MIRNLDKPIGLHSKNHLTRVVLFFCYLWPMPTIQPATPFALYSLAPNAIITANAWNGIANATRYFHEKGENVLSLQGQSNRNQYTPAVGIGTANGGVVIGARREIASPFTVLAGYDQYSLLVRYYMPSIYSYNSSTQIRSAKFTVAIGTHQLISISSGFASPLELVLVGQLPVIANSGFCSQAFLKMSFEVTALDGSSIQGEQLSPNANKWWGIGSIHLNLHKNFQC